MKSGLNSYKLALAIIFIFVSQELSANTKIEILNSNLKIDFMSMHIWRGFATTYSPTIEPSFDVTRNNSTTGIWVAQSLDGNYTELDLYFKYTLNNFSFTIYDYYCPPSYKSSNEIADYNKYTTKHTIEFDFAFNGTQYFPIKILVATMVYGDDLDVKTNKKRYSSYFQFGYSTEIDNSIIDLVLGFNAFESYYGNQFGVVNAGVTVSKDLKTIKSRKVPLQISLITNPSINSLFLSFGFTL